MVLVSLDAQAYAGAAMLDLHARISVNAMQNAATEANLPKQFVTVVKMTVTVTLVRMSATIDCSVWCKRFIIVEYPQAYFELHLMT